MPIPVLLSAVGKTFFELALTIPMLTLELCIIYVFLGWNPENWLLHGPGMVGAVSIGAIFMVASYHNSKILKLFSKQPFWFNITLFNLINLPLAFFFYFIDLKFIKFIANGGNYDVGVILHQSNIFFIGGILTTWAAGYGPGWSATSKGIFQYFLSWVVWATFSSTTMRNTSLTNYTVYHNTFQILISFSNSITFTNLQKLSIFKLYEYRFNNMFEQFMYVGLFTIVVAFVQYFIVFWITFLIYEKDNLSQAQLCNTVGNYISISWAGMNLVGRHIGPAIYHSIVKFGFLGYVLYIVICWTLAGLLSAVCGVIYQEIIWKLVLIKMFGISIYANFPKHDRLDFIFGFGIGNLILVYDGVQFFSGKGWKVQKLERIRIKATETDHGLRSTL
ncbi:Transmembrane domain-containing protein [Spironucleus salmonicida]|uniref:Transmembrane domain-containing protein n=1 Tax=Spironucleus salmonicida TaxID=348837 RepID=V6LII3_9EUKA|nr:Transmembrane domain-containing protein [Spironucleus salmonicida]|eukprot:EST44400.1 Transmembrane domain-containing protein [Spironucleus salmonicida]